MLLKWDRLDLYLTRSLSRKRKKISVLFWCFWPLWGRSGRSDQWNPDDSSVCLVSLGRIQTTCPRLATTTCSCSAHQRLLLFYFLFATSCSPTSWSQGGSSHLVQVFACLFSPVFEREALFSRCSFHITNVNLIYRFHIEAPEDWCRIGVGQMSVIQVSCSAERRSVCNNRRKADLFWTRWNKKPQSLKHSHWNNWLIIISFVYGHLRCFLSNLSVCRER